mmetsp:Transcript_38774/g.81350  ORF Transcript_38774/g.81350 Transcript_38774/m.81350 type:complete len:87 (-) Transcript_38774:110-370(-)
MAINKLKKINFNNEMRKKISNFQGIQELSYFRETVMNDASSFVLNFVLNLLLISIDVTFGEQKYQLVCVFHFVARRPSCPKDFSLS